MGMYDDAVEYQAEAHRNGDVLSQIGFGAGKVGVDATTFVAGGAIINAVGKTAQGARVAANIADVIVKHPQAVSYLAQGGAVLLSAKTGVDAGQAINAGMEGDWETATYKAGSTVIDLALVRSMVSGIRQTGAENPVGNIVDMPSTPVANSQAVAQKGAVEQYTLRALKDGFYPVMKRGFKEPQGGVWLSEGDVWKYGTTKNPATRYPLSFLDKWDLRYRTESVGTLGEALSAEKSGILGYREEYGNLPPGNKIVK